MQERRLHDRHVANLIEKLDEHRAILDEHSKLIAKNSEDVARVVDRHDALTGMLSTHMAEENATLDTVAKFLRDLKGFDAIIQYGGKAMKWLLIIATLGGLTTYILDMIDHLRHP